MIHQEYCGKRADLKGRTALVRDDPESRSRGVLAQFDFKQPGVADDTDALCFGWHSFYAWEFKDLPK